MSSFSAKARRLVWPDGHKARALRLAAAALALAAAVFAGSSLRSELLTPCSVWEGEARQVPVSFTGLASTQEKDFIREYYQALQLQRAQWIADLTYPFDRGGADKLVRNYGQSATGAATAAFGTAKGAYVAVCLTSSASGVRHVLSIYRPIAGGPWAIDTKRTLSDTSNDCPT